MSETITIIGGKAGEGLDFKLTEARISIQNFTLFSKKLGDINFIHCKTI